MFGQEFKEWLEQRAASGDKESAKTLKWLQEDESLIDDMTEAWDEVMENGGREVIDTAKEIISKLPSTRA